jgi:hypothetical protein
MPITISCTQSLSCRDKRSQSVRIVPLLHHSVLTKFLVVEIQLLLKGLEGDEHMHENYVGMRNKLAN